MKVKDYNKLQKLFLILVLIYVIVATYFFISRPAGSGDEILFISDLQFIKENGWLKAIQKNVSLPYMILALPFAYFLENFIALRLVNVVLLFFLFGYFYKREIIDNFFFFSLPFILYKCRRFLFYRY